MQHSCHLSSFLLLCSLVAARAGAQEAAPSTLPPAPGRATSCQVRLFVETSDNSVVAMDASDGFRGVCVKWPGKPVAVPSGIRLWLRNGRTVDTDHVWSVLWRRNASPICAEGDLPDAEAHCTWNGTVRDKFPMSFRVAALDAIPLSTYVQELRAYLNGDQVFAWSGNEAQREVVIPSSVLKRGKLLPYGVQFDLHLIAPAGNPAAKIEAATNNALPGKLSWAAVAGQAALRQARAQLSVEAQQNLQCLSFGVKQIADSLTVLANKGTRATEEQAPEQCARPVTPAELAALMRYFEAIENGIELADGERLQAEQVLDSIVQWLGTDSKRVLAAVESTAAERQPLPEVARRALRSLGERLAEARALTGTTRSAIIHSVLALRQVSAEVKRVANDTSAQSQMFADYAARLEAEGGPFDQRRPNPAPKSDSSVLYMKYADVFQTFLLAPWHAVPVSITEDAFRGEISAGNAVPVIDLVGARWQWTTSRFADLRLGAGGFFLPDQYVEHPGTANETTRKVFNPGFEANVGIANLHFGFGLVVGSRVQEDTFAARARYMVGLDLYKLITGENLEVQ